MKQFLSWFGKKAMSGMVTALFFILGVLWIVYALNYPNMPPAGEVAGGKFMGYFNNMFVGCTGTGVVKSFTSSWVAVCVEWGGGLWLWEGQTWQDVKASRSAGTWYTNNTGKSISVAIYYYDTPGVGDGEFTVSPDWWATFMRLSYFENNQHVSFDHIIPYGWSYKFSGSAGTWHELR